MKPFLILQLRPETEAADDEFRAFLEKGGLGEGEVRRIRLDREPLPGDLDLHDYSGVIVGGGPGCVSDPPEEKDPLEARIEAEIMGLMPEITGEDYPFLGCCYGIGVLGAHLGGPGAVSKEKWGEKVGPSPCRLTDAGTRDPLLAGVAEEFNAFVGHKEALQLLPEGCAHLVQSPACPFQMVRYGRNVYATQFHPEADGDVFELRIRVYGGHGYFAPEEAEALIETCRAAEVTEPVKILRNFVARYRSA